MKKLLLILLAFNLFTTRIYAQTQGINLGKTTYSLQSNASPRNGIQVAPSGQISTVFTGSLELNTTFSDRGTFYNYFNGSAWLASPTSRIEIGRTGFPSIAYTQTGKEFVVAHNANITLSVNTRSTIGSGNWITQSGSFPGFFPRAVNSFGDYVHVICTNNQFFKDNYIMYYRSANAGITWENGG
jgi:hypothetical protein